MPSRRARATIWATAWSPRWSVRSAGLLLVEAVPWPVADLRVDWHDEPIHELARLWALWQPQLDAYVARALDPREAPSYGVPGDE